LTQEEFDMVMEQEDAERDIALQEARERDEDFLYESLPDEAYGEYCVPARWKRRKLRYDE
jgi:hypothetical protein